MFRQIIARAALSVCIAVGCAYAAEPVPLSGVAPAATQASATPAKKFKVLVLTQSLGYKHSVVTRPGNAPGALSLAESVLSEIGTKSGVFDAECIQDATLMTPDKLKETDAIVFYTSGDLPMKPAAFTPVQNWLRGGKAVIGIHSATDTFKEFRPYFEMMGATYLRHPWNHGAAVSNLEPKHPAVKMFPVEFDWNDELCEHQYFDPKKVRVLLAVNTAQSSPKLPKMVPLCWVREYGKGRVFYTNFGNSEKAWADGSFRAHVLGGIRWALKLDDGSAEPNRELCENEDTRARLAVLESHTAWLNKAAKAAGADPAAVLASATKLASEDKAGFLKLHESIATARADEARREGALKPKQKPNDADVKAVLQRRKEVVTPLIPKKDPPIR